MKGLRIHLLTVCVAALLASGAAAVEFRPADGGSGKVPSYRYFKQTTARPGELSLKTPKFKSSAPLYISIGIGDDLDSTISGAMDESRGAGKGYDTLYLDADNDGDLTNDTPVALKSTGASNANSLESDPVTVTVSYFDGSELPLRVRIDFSRSLVKGKKVWKYFPRLLQHVEAKVDLGSRKGVLVGIYDMPSGRGATPNGCFGDYGVDQLRIDRNGDGTLDAATESRVLSRIFDMDGDLWVLDVDSAASEAGISRCTLPSGGIGFALRPAQGARVKSGRVKIAMRDGGMFLCELGEGKTLRAPAGRYTVSSQNVRLCGADGEEWIVSFSMPSKATVIADKDAAIELGPPFEVKPKISGTARAGSRISINSTLIGAAGEVYDSVRRVNRRRAPRVKIVDDKEAVLAQGSMSYG
jgi:hypothetical protein